MSDLMLTAVLSMPYDMAMGDEFSRRQFYDRAQQALEVIERLTAERDSLQSSFDSEWAAVERLHTEIEAVRAANRESKMLVAAAIDDIAKARSAMVALLGIVRNWREIFLQQDQQVPEIWQSVAKLDAVIAQADAAMGGGNE